MATSISKFRADGNKEDPMRLAAEASASGRSKRLDLEPEDKPQMELASVRAAIRKGINPYGSREWRAVHRVLAGIQCQGAGMSSELGGSTIVSVHRESPKACSVFCEETGGCVAWSWNMEGVSKNCHAHSLCLRRVLKANMISGFHASLAGKWYFKSTSDTNDYSIERPHSFTITGDMCWTDSSHHVKLAMVGGLADYGYLASMGLVMFGPGGLLWNEELQAKFKATEPTQGGCDTARLRLMDGKIMLRCMWSDGVSEFIAEKKQQLFQPFDRVTLSEEQAITTADVRLWKNVTQHQAFILNRGATGTVDNPNHPHKTGVIFDQDPHTTVYIDDTFLVKSAILKELSEHEVGVALGSLKDVLTHAIKDPITHEIFRDPVMASDGYTYERSAMEKWIARAEGSSETPKSPLTLEPLSSAKLSSNYAIRSLVSTVIESVDTAREASTKIQKCFRGFRFRKTLLALAVSVKLHRLAGTFILVAPWLHMFVG